MDHDSSAGGGYEYPRYAHFWKPHPQQPEQAFPDEDGLAVIGERGWELVSVTPTQESLVTQYFTGRPNAHQLFTVFTLWFKRPLPDGEAEVAESPATSA